MKIIDDISRLVLAYIAGVEKRGGKLSVEALNAYGDQPERIEFNDMYGVQAGRGVLVTAQVSKEDDEPWVGDERFDRFFARLHWIEVNDGTVTLTQLGRAVLAEASSPEVEAESALEVLIDPGSQFAYAQVMNKIAQVGECLVVDPYLNAESAIDLGQMDSVKSVLTGDRNIKKLRGQFGIVMRARPDFEIRYAEQSVLHDRYVIPMVGKVHVLGSSLNSIAHRQGVITTLEQRGSQFISEAYKELWRGASRLVVAPETKKEDDSPAQRNLQLGEATK